MPWGPAARRGTTERGARRDAGERGRADLPFERVVLGEDVRKAVDGDHGLVDLSARHDRRVELLARDQHILRVARGEPLERDVRFVLGDVHGPLPVRP